ncbi:phosphoribosylglycinamide formyltransferase [Myxococcota bacterium]|nr:phosphoribosylglycinamide formyltransferase [Myxococcota bacterium]
MLDQSRTWTPWQPWQGWGGLAPIEGAEIRWASNLIDLEGVQTAALWGGVDSEDAQKSVVRGDPDVEASVIWGANDVETSVIWGANDVETSVIWGANDAETSVIWGANDAETSVIWGAKILVLGSGSGSNFEALVKALRPYGVECIGLFCDRSGALILSRAQRLGVRCVEPPPPQEWDKRTLNDAVMAFLEQQPFDLALLAGYMRVLPPRVVRPFLGKIVNIHPSILPDYPGLDAIRRAYVAQDAWVGVSIHLVDEGVDEGPILSQGRIPRHDGESLDSLESRVHQLEHTLYPWTVLAWLAQRRRARRNDLGGDS